MASCSRCAALMLCIKNHGFNYFLQLVVSSGGIVEAN
jgi:hypothetical protein